MKKYFLFAMIAVLGIMLVSCESGEGQGKNPYPYLRLTDIAPLLSNPLSKAEAKLTEMEFKFDKIDRYNEYWYYSKDNLDSICCYTDEKGIVQVIYYFSYQKGVSPAMAKDWLAHIPETVKLPNYSKSIPFQSADIWVDMSSQTYETVENYSDYMEKLNNRFVVAYPKWWIDDNEEHVDVQILYDGSAKSDYSAHMYLGRFNH